MRTVLPVATSPESGMSRPAIRLSSVDLPLPFRPTTPIRSSRSSIRSKSRSTVLPAKDLLTPWSSTVFFPRREETAESSNAVRSSGPD